MYYGSDVVVFRVPFKGFLTPLSLARCAFGRTVFCTSNKYTTEPKLKLDFVCSGESCVLSLWLFN